jgi:hypothetical protein
MKAAHDFFISYTKSDKDYAVWIAWALEQEGYDCVIQAWDFVPGKDFVRAMREALDSSRETIAVLSDDYFKSKLAQKEMQAAFASDCLLPIRVRPCTIPKLYQTNVYIDLVDKPMLLARKALIEGVDAHLVGRRAHHTCRFTERPHFPGQIAETRRSGKRGAPRTTATLENPLRVLFLGSKGGADLDIRGEYRNIRKSIGEAKYPSSIKLIPGFDVTSEIIFSKLNQVRPHVLHFAGKQYAGRILVNTKDGRVESIPESALAGMFRSLDEGIRVVILDTCHSVRCASQITETVDFAMGVKSWIDDEEAINFYAAFYRAIASGRSLKDASGQATAFATMKGAAKSRLPELRCKRGMDPAQCKIAYPYRPMSPVGRKDSDG